MTAYPHDPYDNSSGSDDNPQPTNSSHMIPGAPSQPSYPPASPQGSQNASYGAQEASYGSQSSSYGSSSYTPDYNSSEVGGQAPPPVYEDPYVESQNAKSQTVSYDGVGSGYYGGTQPGQYGSEPAPFGSHPGQYGHLGSAQSGQYGAGNYNSGESNTHQQYGAEQYNSGAQYGSDVSSYGSSSQSYGYSNAGDSQMGVYNPMPASHEGYPQQPMQPQTNTMAMLSLIISCVGIFTGGLLAIVGVILGHIGLNQIKKTGESGRGLGLAGLIIGYIQVAVIAIIVLLFFIAFIGAAAGM